MRRFRPIVPKIALVVLVPFLLGVEKCDSSPVMDLLNHIAQLVKDLEQRVTELEACDCGGVLAPVCGEDGVTYVNACKARCAGVSVAYVGECRPRLCGSDQDCAGGEFCEYEDGACLPHILSPDGVLGAPVAGECVPVPNGCPEIYAPVCGCDGVTYDNDCFRRAARVSKAHDGCCEEPPPRWCGGVDELQCPSDDQVCIFPPSTCDVPDNVGRCVERPICITLEWDPVCGCDGQTYSNICHATRAGVSIDYKGECQPEVPSCGGVDELQCPSDDQVCIFPPGTCDVVDNIGECVERSDRCLQVYKRVCGCDGRTYSNSCFATAAGVSIDHEGPCRGGDE